MVIDIAHDKGVAVPLEGHAVLRSDIDFENTWTAPYRVAAQPRMPEINVEKTQGFIRFTLYFRG